MILHIHKSRIQEITGDLLETQDYFVHCWMEKLESETFMWYSANQWRI